MSLTSYRAAPPRGKIFAKVLRRCADIGFSLDAVQPVSAAKTDRRIDAQSPVQMVEKHPHTPVRTQCHEHDQPYFEAKADLARQHGNKVAVARGDAGLATADAERGA